MTFEYKTHGVCSQLMRFEIEDNIVHNVEIVGGCNGNSQGVASLVEGMDIDEVIRRTKGIHCGWKDTSCPDQLAQALTAAKEKMAQERKHA